MKGLWRGYGGAMKGLWRSSETLGYRMNIGILCYLSSNICSVRVKYPIEYGVVFKI